MKLYHYGIVMLIAALFASCSQKITLPDINSKGPEFISKRKITHGLFWSAAYNDKENQILIAPEGGDLLLYDLDSGKIVHKLVGAPFRFHDIYYDHTDDIYLAENYYSLYLLDAKSLRIKNKINLREKKMITALYYDPNEKLAYFANDKQKFFAVNPLNGKFEKEITLPERHVYSIVDFGSKFIFLAFFMIKSTTKRPASWKNLKITEFRFIKRHTFVRKTRCCFLVMTQI